MRLLRRIVETSTQLIGRLKRNQRKSIPSQFSPVKVNLGCGLAVTAGWVNIDGSLNALVSTLPRPLYRLAYRLTGASRYYSEDEYCRLLRDHYFIHHDLAHSIPLANGVADFVYSSHFLEHLFRRDGENILAESFRVLKPGGTIRVVVPDLAYALSLYSAGEKEKMLLDNFFVEDDDSYYARHKYMYDFAMLDDALKRAGFHDIRRCEFRKGHAPDLASLDNRPDESLFVEATR
jgi:predicted SAM-dependent methyltransferase